jgi:hypothetical protein
MEMTPLLHKPVSYGDGLGAIAFVVLLVLHFVPAGVAPVAGIVAMAATKGRKLHVRAGKLFVVAMVATAITGIFVDGWRLVASFAENHQKLPGYGMPSTIPARIAFLYAAVVILYLAFDAGHVRVFQRRLLPFTMAAKVVPAFLVAGCAAVTALVAVRFNPWTGSLWMIWSCGAAVVVAAVLRRRQSHHADAGVARHRFAMLFLFAFALWGALQGFVPAIFVALKGVDDSVTAYTGHLPGAFSPRFFLFLVGWAPPFVLAAWLLRRFARRRRARVPSALVP